MVNGKTPIYLTILAAGLCIGGLLTFQPYSADWPGGGYTKAARRYIRAALQHDSARLALLSTSDAPVSWALRAARTHADSLALWKGRIRAWTGSQAGDTTEVFVYPARDGCDDSPIQFRFVGSGPEARVLSASSSCLDSAGPP
jgi:hypothetical protein